MSTRGPQSAHHMLDSSSSSRPGRNRSSWLLRWLRAPRSWLTTSMWTLKRWLLHWMNWPAPRMCHRSSQRGNQHSRRPSSVRRAPATDWQPNGRRRRCPSGSRRPPQTMTTGIQRPPQTLTNGSRLLSQTLPSVSRRQQPQQRCPLAQELASTPEALRPPPLPSSQQRPSRRQQVQQTGGQSPGRPSLWRQARNTNACL